MALIPGQVLNNRYRIVKLLGQGGFGAVYKAWDVNLNRAVAVKENLETTPASQSQFNREASILAHLRHPDLPQVNDYFFLPGQGQYLVMDYVEGEDLEEKRQKAGGFLSEDQVLPWIIQVLDALEYLHNEQPSIIHRDIKPANIKISPKDRAILVDFGIAKIFDAQSKTTVGARAVTPGYSPLEQYSQGKTDARSDIYALGATLYTTLTGHEPPESVQRTMGLPLPSPRSINQAISPQTEQAILRAMDMTMDHRFQSASEFKEALIRPIAQLDQLSSTAASWQKISPEPTIVIPLQGSSTIVVQPTPTDVITQSIPSTVVDKSLPQRIHRAPTRRISWIWVGLAMLLILVIAFVGKMIISPESKPFLLIKPKLTNTITITTVLPEATLLNIPTFTPSAAINPTETFLPNPQQVDCSKPDVFCVGLVTDVGKIDDKTFNQSAYEALKQAETDLGAQIKYIETTDTKDYDKNIAIFGDASYDVIVTVGFNLAEATQKAAPLYPKIKFIGIDQYQAAGTEQLNLAGLNFPEDQAGFLVGALAAMMTKTNKIGAVCGTDAVAPVWRFGEGYRSGAEYINPAVEVIVIYHNDVGFDKTFTDPEWGKITAISMIDKGVDVIFGAGGKTGNGALEGAAENGVYAIGVDTDQYFTVPKAQKVLLSSAVKMIIPGTLNLIRLAKENLFPSGNYYGSAGYAPYHDLDSKVPTEVKVKMELIAKDLLAGTLKPNVAPAKPSG